MNARATDDCSKCNYKDVCASYREHDYTCEDVKRIMGEGKSLYEEIAESREKSQMKTCPYCGKPGMMDVTGDGVHRKYQKFYPTSSDRHCMGRNKTKYFRTWEEAEAAWNRRDGK